MPITLCVIPAKAGTRGRKASLLPWMPAFAGMTASETRFYSRATLTGWRVAAERTIASNTATPCRIWSAGIG